MENLLTNEQLTGLSYGIVFLSVLVIYFMPIIIAVARDHSSGGSIIVINLFLGWTLFGWVTALALSLSGDRATRVRKRRGVTHELNILSRLKDKGHLSTKEFEKQKRNLLA